MWEIAAKSLELAAKFSWAVAVAISFVLFMPEEHADKMKITEIRENYLGYLWIGLVLTTLISLGAIFSSIRSVFKEMYEERKAKKAHALGKAERQRQLASRLNALSDDEHRWIAYCLFNRVQTLYTTQINKTANSLRGKGIVVQGGGSILELPFHIQDDAWEYLNTHIVDFVPADALTNIDFQNAINHFHSNLTDRWGRI